jgi:hypothetical protein
LYFLKYINYKSLLFAPPFFSIVLSPSNLVSSTLVSYLIPPLNSILKPKISTVSSFSTISSSLMGSYSRRIMRFLENDISARLEMEVANGVVLSSHTRLHAGDRSFCSSYLLSN